jgi:hypothetical protein
VFYNHKPVLISRENSKRYAVFGIPLSAPVGILNLETNIAPIQIEIKAFSYAEQRLNVKNQDYVNPTQAQLDRYAREAKEQNDIYDSFTNSTWTQFPILSVQLKVNSVIHLVGSVFLMEKNVLRILD